MRKTEISLKLVLSVLLIANFTEVVAQSVMGTWSGSVRLQEKFTGLTGTSERLIIVNINDNIATGSVKSDGEAKISGVLLSKGSCSGTGKAELHQLIINQEEQTYLIEVISPDCIGEGYDYGSKKTKPIGPHNTMSVTVSNKPLVNLNVLAGTETTTKDVSGMGTVTATLTWNLSRSVDGELIVTPEDYDNWLPKAGSSELMKGSVLNIALKLLGRNGQAPAMKAKSFELRLSNTSKEPGITLNAPITPSANQLPDLRLLKQPLAESREQGQFLTITCSDGSTGKASIGSYDGGGWTTLTVEAILEDNTRIKGSLMVAGGEQEILIPKRSPGTKIASSWLNANSNPGETDDKESSQGNNNNGDGLTAYEEYRGVMSEGTFLRLDPNTKEVGVKMNMAEIPLFADGISKFENATDLKVIRFFENEIGIDRKLNKNHLTAHLYEQYALFLQSEPLVSDLGKSFGSPGIPKQVSKVVIARNNIVQSFQSRVVEANTINTALGYTEKDLFATVTAHELAHSVGVTHHGSLPPNSLNLNITAARTAVRIFNHKGVEVLTRPYPITGRGGEAGNEQSGDVNCFMLNNFLCDWVVKTTADSMFFYEVPVIPLGTRLCDKKDGKGLNVKDANGNNNYFGDAANGNCLSLVKLKE